MKLAKILEWILLGLSLVLLVAFFVMPHDVASDPAVNLFIVWAYVLLFAAIALVVVFLLKDVFSSKKSLVSFLLLLVGIVVLIAASYFLAKGGEVATSAPYTEQVSKLSDTVLNLTYIMFGASVLALIVTGVMNAIRNR